MARLIDADATVQYLRRFRCADCDKRKGMKNGKVRFCYEIGDAPCRACDIGDTIEYFLDEDIAPTVEAIPVEWLIQRQDEAYRAVYYCGGNVERNAEIMSAIRTVLELWQKEQEMR